MGALTWVVPSGQFERESVRAADGSMHMVVRPGTYHEVPKHSAAGDLRQGVAISCLPPRAAWPERWM